MLQNMCPRDPFAVVLASSLQERRCTLMLSGDTYVHVQTEVGPTRHMEWDFWQTPFV